MSKCVCSKFQETQASEKPTCVWEGVSRIVARARVGREWVQDLTDFCWGRRLESETHPVPEKLKWTLFLLLFFLKKQLSCYFYHQKGREERRGRKKSERKGRKKEGKEKKELAFAVTQPLG